MPTSLPMRLPVRFALLCGVAIASMLVVGGAPASTVTPRHSAITVRERDFRISAPRHVAAGDVALVVHNAGPDMHELIVVRERGARLPLRADGMTVDEDAVARDTPGNLEPGQPGSTRTLRVALHPGRYVLLCNMSGHYLGGMETELVVGR